MLTYAITYTGAEVQLENVLLTVSMNVRLALIKATRRMQRIDVAKLEIDEIRIYLQSQMNESK